MERHDSSMTPPITQSKEDEYEGKLKCNKCNHIQSKHRFGVDICLHTNCYCDRFISPTGGLKWLDGLHVVVRYYLFVLAMYGYVLQQIPSSLSMVLTLNHILSMQ